MKFPLCYIFLANYAGEQVGEEESEGGTEVVQCNLKLATVFSKDMHLLGAAEKFLRDAANLRTRKLKLIDKS